MSRQSPDTNVARNAQGVRRSSLECSGGLRRSTGRRDLRIVVVRLTQRLALDVQLAPFKMQAYLSNRLGADPRMDLSNIALLELASALREGGEFCL